MGMSATNLLGKRVTVMKDEPTNKGRWVAEGTVVEVGTRNGRAFVRVQQDSGVAFEWAQNGEHYFVAE
jgi:hypothetical protein